jgi:hypothetical protein
MMVADDKHDIAAHLRGKLTTMYLAMQWRDLASFVSMDTMTATHRIESLRLLLEGLPSLHLMHGAQAGSRLEAGQVDTDEGWA